MDQYQQQQQGGFGFDVNQYEAQAPMEVLPPTWYNVFIEDAEMKPLQSGKGTACANVYVVFGGPWDGRKVFDNLNVIHENEQAQDIARRQLRTIQDSIGKQSIAGPWDLKGAYLCVKVGHSKPNKNATDAEKAAHEVRNEVKGYKPFDQALHAQNQQQPAQGYNVQVQPQGPQMGNMPNFAPQSPQFAQQPMQQQMPQQQFQQPQMQPQGQPQVQPQQQFQPQQQQQMQPPQQPQQQAPQQAQPQQQFAPQQQNFQQPGSMQPGAGNSVQPGQVQNAPDAMAQAGQNSPQQAGPSAAGNAAPPATFAPQQGAMPNAQPPGPNQQVQQPQPMQQQQMAQPNPQFQPQQQQGQQQPTGNAPPPTGAW